MTREQTTFVLWALAIVGAATAAIIYQHGQHTGIILSLAGSGKLAGNLSLSAVPGAISSNPVNSPGANSAATGVWTPTGPTWGLSTFPYNPAQWGYGGGQTGA